MFSIIKGVTICILCIYLNIFCMTFFILIISIIISFTFYISWFCSLIVYIIYKISIKTINTFSWISMVAAKLRKKIHDLLLNILIYLLINYIFLLISLLCKILTPLKYIFFYKFETSFYDNITVVLQYHSSFYL